MCSPKPRITPYHIVENRVVHYSNFGRPTSATGQNPNASRMLACQLSPAADKRRIGSIIPCADFVAKVFLHS
jgi:hypothetical protein